MKLFNGKHLCELDFNSQCFLKDLFGDVIDDTESIRCWKNKMVQKTDIFIKYKNYIKNISLKCGNGNSIHHEQIQEFKRYLEKLYIPYKVIEKYVSYHYGYDRDNDGNIDYSIKMSAEEYKKKYQSEIDIFNEYIDKTRIIVDMIDRFIVVGRNSDYGIDALACGTIDDYVWILKYDIYDLILSKNGLHLTSPHVGCMTIGPKKRLLDDSSNNIRDKYLVCVRWNFIKEDIINFKSGQG